MKLLRPIQNAIRGSLVGLGLLAVAGGASAQTRELSGSGQLLDRIAAVVNDGVVLNSQLEEQTEEITQRLRQQNTELPPRNVLRQQILERLVVEEIQMQRADKLGIQVSDEMLNGALDDVAKRNNIGFADLPQALAQQGIDYRTFRDEIRRQMTLQLLRQRDVIARINVSPRELEQFMTRQANAPDRNAEYNVSHILISVPVSASPEQIEAREKRAREVYDKASSGEDFAQLAVAYSDSSTNIEGGSLGWRRGSQLPSILAENIPKMKVGQTSEPIRTPSGFHLFRLNEMRGGVQQAVVQQVHARHILLKTNELEDDQTIEQKLRDIRKRVLEEGEDFAAIAAVTSQDPGSAADGGDLGWAGPGSFVPEFEKQLDALKENEISPPFKSQYGWHIVQVLGRRQHDSTEDLRRQRAFAELREAKAEEETELWLRRLRDEAFVDYRM
ncbi:peptidylprolyl isomerase [Steroidobacter sp. S1-65]|uniref:Chaperone SurA n=1 Tax=Steroidobacter gossypii TaxID=2805490 RepID=A0ABS1X5H6_9GAMM|nr:peptidylprolyl isomerase [Steroidobacter gossypii]MBM0108469.1 peptidylprolyl isomerase [Steroidobacter gossypii]